MYKLGKRVESRYRDFGYGLKYQNVPFEAMESLHQHLFVLAMDKVGFEQVKHHTGRYPRKTLVIHDTIEIRTQEHADGLRRGNWNIISIRPKIRDYLLEEFGLESLFIPHPFYDSLPSADVRPLKKPGTAVSCCRIDFDKHQEIMLQTNRLLSRPAIKIWGAVNQMYVYHKLAKDGLEPELDAAYQGTYPLQFGAVNEIMKEKQFAVDLTYIHKDGGGTQYTFLEAIANDCVLILNRRWIESVDPKYRLFVENHNCLAVNTAEELAEIISLDSQDESLLNGIKDNARGEILNPCLNATDQWEQEIKGA